jgi:UDP-N-acetylmuramate--alanine ligase
MLIWILHQLGLDPSYISGGVISQLGNNAHAGTGDYFVIEADEYDHMFLGLAPQAAIITNIEHDHADCFPTPQDYRQAFLDFIHCVQPGGTILLCDDDPAIRSLLTDLPGLDAHLWSYGTGPDVHYSAESITFINGYPQFELLFRDENGAKTHLGTVKLQVPGHHNVLNATAALGLIHQLELPISTAHQALHTFTGAGRRFEVLGQADGITIINDYGHHPTEMAATLEAARSRYPDQRIWAIWQPHTYSRTKALANRFSEALSLADRVMVLKIYAAREADPGFSAEQIANSLPAEKAAYAPTFEDGAKGLLNELEADDIVIIFSAGDAIQLSEMVLRGLQHREKSQQETLP